MDYFAQPESVTFRHVIDAPAGGLVEASASFISILFSLNLLLMVFNLVPVPPLDGSTAIGLLVSESTALRIYEFMRQPGFSLIGLLIAWNLFGRIFSPVFLFAVNVLYPGSSYR